MGEAWKERRGVAGRLAGRQAGRQRTKRHSDVIVELLTQTASQRAAMAARIFFCTLLVFSVHRAQWSDLSAPSLDCLFGHTLRKVWRAKEIRNGRVSFLEISPRDLETHIIIKQWNLHIKWPITDVSLELCLECDAFESFTICLFLKLSFKPLI